MKVTTTYVKKYDLNYNFFLFKSESGSSEVKPMVTMSGSFTVCQITVGSLLCIKARLTTVMWRTLSGPLTVTVRRPTHKILIRLCCYRP